MRSRLWTFLVAFVIGAAAGWYASEYRAAQRSAQTTSSPATPAETRRGEVRTCTRVVDGDTIVLDGGERVRYIGIDTPETKHPRKPVQRMGPEATAANRRLVEGKQVRLEYDVERQDRYGRTLAYVWFGNRMVNEVLVRAGYAQVSTYPPNVKYVERFQAAQREAREAGRGLWGDAPNPAQDPLLGPQGDEEAAKAPTPPAPPETATTVYVTRTGSKYHRDGCQYLRRSRIPVTLEEALARGCTACSRCRP